MAAFFAAGQWNGVPYLLLLTGSLDSGFLQWEGLTTFTFDMGIYIYICDIYIYTYYFVIYIYTILYELKQNHPCQFGASPFCFFEKQPPKTKKTNIKILGRKKISSICFFLNMLSRHGCICPGRRLYMSRCQ